MLRTKQGTSFSYTAIFVEVEPGLMTSNFIDVFIIYDLQFDSCEISFAVSEPQLVRHAIAML